MHSHKTKARKHHTHRLLSLSLSLSLSNPFAFSTRGNEENNANMKCSTSGISTVTHLRVEMGKRVLSLLPSVKIKQQNTTKKLSKPIHHIERWAAFIAF
jgi:hypothetical protein